jgi:hypothetical protein
MICSGRPTAGLAKLVAAILRHLNSNYRCLYFNSPQMVEGISAYLTTAGLNVAEQIFRRRLIISSDQGHLRNGRFDPQLMIEHINAACEQAVAEGYTGLWASGDMAWEFGPAKDFTTLLEYERPLERLFATQPMLHGVCQYHVDTLPANVAETAVQSHSAIFVNETLSKLNPQYRVG